MVVLRRFSSLSLLPERSSAAWLLLLVIASTVDLGTGPWLGSVYGGAVGLREKLSVYEQRRFQRQIEESENNGLYDATDSVISLTAANLKQRVFNQPHASLVEFYNSYCGFCRRFAPIWKQLAVDILGWQKLVRVTALDCSRDENNAVCREFEVMAYPTIRFFAPYYTDGEQKIGEPVKEHDGQRITDRLVEYMQHVENKPTNWPNLTAINRTDDKATLFESGTLGAAKPKYVYLINEKDSNATTGLQVILDFHDTPEVTVYRSHDPTLAANGLSAIDGASMSIIALPVDEFSRVGLREAIRTHLRQHNILVTDVSTKSTKKAAEGGSGTTEQNISALMEQKQEAAIRAKVKELGAAVVYQADLEEAIRFALYHEISRYKSIEGDRLMALRNFLNVLVRYFPFNDNGRRFLTELRQYVLNAGEERLDGEAFVERVRALETERKPVFSSNHWIGCSGSKDGLRRYPCGLWTLFHYLTVQAAENDLSNNPLEVLEAMHGYIKHFFGCSECSQHFQQMADRNRIWQVLTKDDAILWLWTNHNEVNKRLAGDATEDPEHPKIQFPSVSDCAQCRRKILTNHHNHQQYTMEDGKEWNLTEVLTYLKHMYAYERRNLFGLHDSSLAPQGTDGRSEWSGAAASGAQTSYHSYGNVLSDIDIRFSALLYVTCIVMIVIAIKMVVKRGYRKKMYPHDILGKV
ncbi:sulfhydryl oxidase 1-like [Anopheles nili]|uniref:sulfhydryl oxidase 1-like n=1 Tax=Anopheles nili TaxID=185578 RepID=UPI00237A7854|nr:sulfhydryl oxidase 1-like [Anopheles nili]